MFWQWVCVELSAFVKPHSSYPGFFFCRWSALTGFPFYYSSTRDLIFIFYFYFQHKHSLLADQKGPVKKKNLPWHDVTPEEGGWKWAGCTERCGSGHGSRKEEISWDRRCSLRWACDTAWPPVRPGLLPVRKRRVLGQAHRGRNMEMRAGGAAKNRFMEIWPSCYWSIWSLGAKFSTAM